ncbi:hypothetical protein DICSQDRAFT_131598 [Dichomitus squalens LYAD-421 SS1]|uniref:uncharacterized protein n=1 Tax=Dichomitus squalens (strain LYAD-421) TaxID=732165 RepID=UPI000441284B|nr:uncharacterized protein DICSQDRAFT_131598 [Dichomitus squalens LYAD-421 SS1]EJF67329.1 hypothetical protein DICSQDRAFT_131598 [Dichomitus squalens LYAD-421 SS1]
MPSYSPRLLSAGPPSIQVTLASPWTPHSPIFRRHSPITVTKYLQATSPQLAYMMRSGASSGRVASTCPLPSVRSCDICCLTQVEDDIVCWACERQWLACKMWYQANDEGLMEPFMRRAESNADLRAVLESLSVPREDERAGRIGLGSDLLSADTIKKRPPFRVVDPSPVNSGSDRDCPPAGKRFLLFGSRSWRHLRSIFMEARRESRDAVRAWVAASLGPLSPLCRSDEPKLRRRSGGLSAVSTSPLAVHHGLAAIWANCDRPCLSQLSPAYGSQLFGSADNASGSRFIEHLV